MRKINAIKQIMYANSIAVIGASNKIGSVGNELMKRLTEYGYKGKIYPINLKESVIENLKCYKSICDIKENIDLVVIAVPKHIVLSVVDECAKAKVKNLVIVTAGFKEIGGNGAELEKQLSEKVKNYNMNVIGPNCLGVINTNTKMNATFNPISPKKIGKVAFASQSGAIICGIINLLEKKNFNFNQIVSLGNQCDINFLDLVEFWENDSNIEIIMLYVESINDISKFKEICKRVSYKKPIVMLKAGRSKRGSIATVSHTGALAGDDESFSAVIESSGVIREFYLRDFINIVQTFSNCHLPQGNNLAILTNAGGPGIIATDTADDYGINLAELSEETKQKLKSFLPEEASVKNPIDIISSASLEQFCKSAETLLKAPEVDILMVIYLYITVKNDVNLLLELNKLKNKYPNKPIIAVFQTEKNFVDKVAKFNVGIPVFHYGIDALYTLKKLIERKNYLSNKIEKTPSYKTDKKIVEKIIKNNIKNNIKNISTYQSLQIFDAYKIPLPKYELVVNLDEAKIVAKKIGYPLVLKISSTIITHKSDVGGVITDINNEKELEIKFYELYNNLKQRKLLERLEGIIVMEQISGSAREFVAGVTTKPIVGKMAMFGIGGIFIETLKAVKFAPCPLSKEDANNLIKGNNIVYKLLGNVRDYREVNTEKISEILLRLSQLAMDFDEISDIDINPIIANKFGKLISIDARVILK